MKASSACPSESTLRNLVSELLAEEESDRLTNHIGQCPSCQQRLAEAVSGLGPQLPELKKKRSSSPHLQDAIEKAKSLRASPPREPPSTNAEFHEDQQHLTTLTKDGYELLGMIGRGGMGVVYKAREESLDRVVAVKVLSPSLAGDASSRERFLREARAAAAVVHPNVITIHSVSARPPVPYIVMEFVEGCSVQQQLDSGARISIENVVRIGRQMASGLSAAHGKGVVHRDIKPGNTLLSAQTGKVLLGDFGLARAADHSRLTGTGTLVGTPAYVAPEVLENPESADHRADLFSLGVVLYAMCSGDSPFQADSLLGTLHRLSNGQPEPLAERVAGVPDWLSEIVMRLLEKKPNDRFQSAVEVRHALAQGIESQRATARVKEVTAETAVEDTPSMPHVTVDTSSTSRGDNAKRRNRQSRTLWIYAGLSAAAVLIAALCVVAFGPSTSGNAATSTEMAAIGKRTDTTATRGRRFAKVDDEANPFICVNENGNRFERFGSLEEAINSQYNRGRIEIHTNGMVEMRPCSIVGSATTIAAGKGYEPILVSEPGEDAELEAMLHVEGNLTLRGIELYLPESSEEDDFALISVEPSGNVKMIDCTLVAAVGVCVDSQSNLSMENCRLHAPQSLVLGLDPQERARTNLHNCWVSGETGIEVFQEQGHDINITDCTFACSHVLSVYSEHEDHIGSLSIDSRRSLFLCSGAQLVVEREEDGVDHDEDERLARLIRWVGEGNVFAGSLFESSEDEFLEGEGDPDFELWQQHFQETGSAYVQNPFQIDIAELPELVSSVDFRLSQLPKIETISAGAKPD